VVVFQSGQSFWRVKLEKLITQNKHHTDIIWRDLWINIAKGEIGQKEIVGGKHNPRILEYHKAAGLLNVTDELPWCASFLCWVFEMVRITSPRSARSKDWHIWGKEIFEPVLGCIVLLPRHVGLYMGESPNSVLVLGGNQGDQVSSVYFSKKGVQGFRYPISNIYSKREK